MARYGSGYNTSITQALTNIELSITTALVEAWDLFCNKLQDEIDDYWNWWVNEVYEYDPDYYDRTYQLDGVTECPFKVVNGSNGVGTIRNGQGTVVANFTVDELGFTPSNPPYHIFENGGTEDLVNVIGAMNGNVISFVDELKQYLNTNKWQELYRDCCKTVGLTL